MQKLLAKAEQLTGQVWIFFICVKWLMINLMGSFQQWPCPAGAKGPVLAWRLCHCQELAAYWGQERGGGAFQQLSLDPILCFPAQYTPWFSWDLHQQMAGADLRRPIDKQATYQVVSKPFFPPSQSLVDSLSHHRLLCILHCHDSMLKHGKEHE